MASVTIHNDLGNQEEEIYHYFHVFPLHLPCINGARCHDLSFLIFSLKPVPSLSSFTLIKWLFSFFLLSAIRGMSSTYLWLLMFLLLILILVCNSSRPECLMTCSAYRLNKQGDNRQPCLTPFSILSQSVVPYRVLAVAFLTHIQVSQKTIKMVW